MAAALVGCILRARGCHRQLVRSLAGQAAGRTPSTLEGFIRRPLCGLTAQHPASSAATDMEAEAPQSAVNGADATAFLQFENPQYQRFVNMLMKHGKKQTARNIMQRVFLQLRADGHDPQQIFSSAMENVRPMIEVRTVKSRGTQQVPFPLTPKRADGIAMKWIIKAARGRKSTSGMASKLQQELLQAAEGKGTAVARRLGVHQLALANQAAAHFRWRSSSGRNPGEVDPDAKQFRPRGQRVIRRYQAVA